MLVQPSMFCPDSDWKPPELSELPSWKGAKRVGIDLETRDPDIFTLGPGVRREGSYVVGYAFAIEDGPKHYLPVRHEDGGNLDPVAVRKYLEEQSKGFDGLLVGMNLQYDLDWLWNENLFLNVTRVRDVMIAESLIDENQKGYSLDKIAQRRGFPGKDESLLKEAAASFGLNPKKDLWWLHSKFVGAYAEGDADLPLHLARKQEREIEDQELWEVYNLESDLLPVLVRMKQRGVRVDLDRLAQNERNFLEREKQELDAIYQRTGYRLSHDDVWKADAIAEVLRRAGVNYGFTGKGKPNIDRDLLTSSDDPTMKSLERLRAFNKARRDYVTRVRDFMVGERVHPNFNQLRGEKDDGSLSGAAYGRMSCEQPNLQQVPARDPEIGPAVRSQYIAEEGQLWAAEDYSQQEPRLTVHWAEKCGFDGSKEAGDYYRTNPDADNHQMMADMAGIARKDAKSLYLGLIYGMGGAALCDQLGLSTRWLISSGKPWESDYESAHADTWEEVERIQDTFRERGLLYERRVVAGYEGQKLIDQFHEEVPFVPQLAKLAKKRAQSRGYITTLSGRRCRFPKVQGKYDWTHKALNRLIQGSAGDQTKRAVIEVDRAGHYLQLQVHDELTLSVSDKYEAHDVAQIMENCVELTVPSRVDIAIGPSWGEAKE